MKLQSKFLISHLILVLVPTLIISVFFYGRMYNITIDGTIYSEQTYTEQTAYSVEIMLSHIIHRMDFVLNLKLSRNLFHTDPDEALKNTPSRKQD